MPNTADIKRLKNMAKWSQRDYDHYMEMFYKLEKITGKNPENYKQLPEKEKVKRFKAFKKGVEAEIQLLN